MAKAHHVKRGSRVTRVMLVAAGVAVVLAAGVTVAVVLTRRSSGSGAAGVTADNATPTTVKPVLLALNPVDGATGVSLDTVISVSVQSGSGRLDSVVVAAPTGAPLAGTMEPSGLSWRSSAKLALQTSYTVTVDATNAKGRRTEQVSQFQSVVPTATLNVTLFPTTGLTVGIGQPVRLTFNHAVTNKDALLAQLQVTMSTPVAGGWHWFSDRELHFRPEQYWPSGEQVTVSAALADFDAGKGIWATADSSTRFTVGDAHVSTANVATHEMTVTSNGAVVATYPLSAGRSKYPTMNGTHIDLGKQQDVHMVSSTVGIPVNSPDGYDEHVYWDVLITDSGEYVHAAPWSTGAQGNSNVSHGCINLSPANATSFYNFSRVGDIINVTGSPRPASTGDHGTMDWTLPWAQWTQPAGSGSTTTTSVR